MKYCANCMSALDGHAVFVDNMPILSQPKSHTMNRIISLAAACVAVACVARIFATDYMTQYISNMLTGFL